MKCVVVGNDHYNTLWVVRSLGLAGMFSDIVIFDKHLGKSYVSKSKYVRHCVVVKNEKELVASLIGKKEDEKLFLFSTSDIISEMVDRNYNVLSPLYFLPVCNEEQGKLSFWLDKWRMNCLAKEIGFCIPWTKPYKISDGLLSSSGDILYPCIIKPMKSSFGTKNDVRVCRDLQELKLAEQYLKDKCEHVIVQEYIKPDFELTVDCLRYAPSNTTFIPGVIRKDKTCKSTHDMGMVTIAHIEKDVSKYLDISLIKSFLERINYNGLCSFDFFVKDNQLFFLEANLRTDGDMFIYMEAGINFPLLWINQYMGKPLDEDCVLLPKEPTYGMIEISYLRYMDWNNPIQCIKDWWRTDCYSIFSWKDMKPFFYKFIYAI